MNVIHPHPCPQVWKEHGCNYPQVWMRLWISALWISGPSGFFANRGRLTGRWTPQRERRPVSGDDVRQREQRPAGARLRHSRSLVRKVSYSGRAGSECALMPIRSVLGPVRIGAEARMC